MISWKSLSGLEEQIPSINKGTMMQSRAEIDGFCCLKLSSFPFAEGKARLSRERGNRVFLFPFPILLLFYKIQWSMLICWSSSLWPSIRLCGVWTGLSCGPWLWRMKLPAAHCSRSSDWAVLRTVTVAEKGMPYCISCVDPSPSPLH